MALPVWPAGLPHMPHVHAQPEPYRENLESEMNAGNIRTRPQFTAAIGIVEMTIRMTTAQYVQFRVFVRDTLKKGSAEFTMPVWDLVGCPVRRVRLRNGGHYVPARIGSRIDVSFALDVWDL